MNLFRVSDNYLEFLRTFDHRIMDNKDTTRPYVGIIFNINNYTYFAPLSSPKPKHMKMHNSIDFQKIDGGKLGAINFNNMIPIPISQLLPLELSIAKNDSTEDVQYKILLAKQLDWCNSNELLLKRKGFKLYNEYSRIRKLVDRCCDFPLLEKKAVKYETEIEK